MSPAPTALDLAKMIEHSLLHPTLTDAQLDAGCRLAIECDAAAACVQPWYVPRAAALLRGSGVAVCAVIGFPHGNSHTEIKVRETELAIREGAHEIDMVARSGHVLGGDYHAVADDIRRVNDACRAGGALLKVIFENDYLEDAHVIRLCEVCGQIGVAFVKTSTGYGFVRQAGGDFNYRGATDHHLRLMRAHCPPAVQIKAAGGIRTLDDLLRVRGLGVTRIGATATRAIVTAALARGWAPGSARLAALAGTLGAVAGPAGR
ncbi:MAG: deoxyribose-phosphate aldolase [Opitutaceae bacterium]|nr:deoxyribose-phosphate aldolase [Opitutaceae bacterium]